MTRSLTLTVGPICLSILVFVEACSSLFNVFNLSYFETFVSYFLASFFSFPPQWDCRGRVSHSSHVTFLLAVQMVLWRCLFSSSSLPRGNLFSVVTSFLSSAPRLTSTSRWSYGGVTTATAWSHRRTWASMWRRLYFMTAACLPGTRGNVSRVLISWWLACCTYL